MPFPFYAVPRRRSALYRSLVAYYPLAEPSGAALDWVQGLNLAASATEPGTDTGKVGACRSFVAADTTHFSRNSEERFQIGLQPWAMMAWDNPANTTSARGILSKGDPSSSGGDWGMYVSSGGTLTFSVRSAANTLVSATRSSHGSGSWRCCIAYHDPAAEVIAAQMDDGTVGTAALSGGTTLGTGAVRLGRYVSSYMDGVIDEVALWRGRIPPAAERTWLYNAGNGRSLAELTVYSSLQILWWSVWDRCRRRGVPVPRWAAARLPRLPACYRGRGGALPPGMRMA